jgi:hypothetical protein
LRHEALLELRRESRLHVEPTARMSKNLVARLQQRYTDWWASEGQYTLREAEGFEWAH